MMSPDAYLEMAKTEERHWWFAGRRAVLASLIAKLKLPPGARILEIGSGTGGNLVMLSSFGQVSALEMDASARSIALEKTRGRFDIRAGFCPTGIPFADEQFDLICLFDVLEHIEEDVATLVAVKGLLAPRGCAVVTVPAHRWLWSVHDEFLHHKRRYSKDELRRKVSAAGLEPTKLSYFNTFLFPLAAAARLKDRMLGASSAGGTRVPIAPLNRLLGWLFGAERFLLGRVDFPFGVSLLVILRANPNRRDSAYQR